MIRIALLMLLAFPACAGPATERYAPVQLQVAQAALDRAERLLRWGEEAAARRLAAQAALDARLAWAMTDSEFLRAQAAELYLSATSLEEEP